MEESFDSTFRLASPLHLSNRQSLHTARSQERCRNPSAYVEISAETPGAFRQAKPTTERHPPEFSYIAGCSFALVLALQMLLTTLKGKANLQWRTQCVP